MKLTKSSPQTLMGPKDWFTGVVFIGPLNDADQNGVLARWLQYVADDEYLATK